MLHPVLPKSSEIQKHIKDMNSQLTITSTPNNTMGVQLNLKTCITTCLLHLLPTTTGTYRKVRIKLTGDDTRIARGLNIVVFAFTVLEKDLNPTSVHGSHPVAIIKSKETFEKLSTSLRNIIDEVSALDKIDINGVTFEIKLFLGGDWKFLAMICGLDSATSRYSCIWCKCPKEQRWDMSKNWSISNIDNGARTINEITELPKSNKYKFNCSSKPLFPFIPITKIIIDTLHLFLRISDVLINLLIRDLRQIDFCNKTTTNISNYQRFLNETCKIHFNWITTENNNIKWRDLTGPEKHRLFKNINIPQLFTISKGQELQHLWNDFYNLIKQLSQEECEASQFEVSAK